MSDYLPPEVLQDILKWLPVKTLLRFRIVSKQWYSLISNPNFISQHLLHTTLRTPPHALFRYCFHDPNLRCQLREHYSLRFDNEYSFDAYTNPLFPFKSSVSRFTDIVGCCNGLLCLSDYISGEKGYRLHLWNPSVGKGVAVPFKGSGSYFPRFGFGFDELTNDHKVVAYMYQPKETEVPPRAEIYSLSSGIWRAISTKGLRYPLELGRETATLNGVTHWDAYDIRKVWSDPESEFIASFSFKDEVFGEIMLPGNGSMASIPSSTDRLLMVYQDSLALIAVDNLGHYWTWVMKNYGVQESWTLLFQVGPPIGFGRPIGFRMNGELVVARMKGELDVECSETSLVSYDPRSKLVKDLVIWDSEVEDEIEDYPEAELEYFIDSFYMERYMESLLLLDKVASTPELIGISDQSLLM